MHLFLFIGIQPCKPKSLPDSRVILYKDIIYFRINNAAQNF